MLCWGVFDGEVSGYFFKYKSDVCRIGKENIEKKISNQFKYRSDIGILFDGVLLSIRDSDCEKIKLKE